MMESKTELGHELRYLYVKSCVDNIMKEKSYVQ